jgi:poly(U)-specific endoribonuclease
LKEILNSRLLSIDDRLNQMPTVEKMKALFNNYELDTLTNEYVTPIERKEENEFLDAILATPVMRQAMNFLQQKGKVTPDPQTHRDLLKTIWFNLYSRGQGKIGSSGFEHVFLSELKSDNVIGLHNWIYFHEMEKAGDLNYKGYSKKIDFGNVCIEFLLFENYFDHRLIYKTVFLMQIFVPLLFF